MGELLALLVVAVSGLFAGYQRGKRVGYSEGEVAGYAAGKSYGRICQADEQAEKDSARARKAAATRKQRAAMVENSGGPDV